MSNTYTIVVTGATGNIGSKVVRRLLDMNQKVRAVARNQQKLEPLTSAGAEIFLADIQDSAAMTKAFSGAKAVFTMIPPNITAPNPRRHYNAVSQSLAEALKNARVAFAVNLSSIGAHLEEKTGPILGLRDNEGKLDAIAGLNILHLRAASFMENLMMQIDLIRNMGIMGMPLRGNLKIPMIATEDIAAEAAERLAELDFAEDGAKELLGEREVSMEEAASVIGHAIGRPGLKYVQFPYDEAQKAMEGMGLSQGFAASLIEMNRSMNDGFLKPAENRSADNTTPTSIEEFVEKTFAPAFRQKEMVGAR